MSRYTRCKRVAIDPSHSQILEFLAPSIFQIRHALRHTRGLSSTSSRRRPAHSQSSDAPHRVPKSGPEAAANPSPPNKPLTQAQVDFLSSALRVNQAGELAATLIYTAQMPPLIAAHPHLRPLMKHMHDQETSHFNTFNRLLARHRIRPTAMYPVWTLAASVLGWSTAIMGKEAAMACTEAVETEIGNHYNSQVRVMLEMADKMKEEGHDIGEELEKLTETLRRIRDEELEHLDHAVENDAQQAVPHALLNGIIRTGCRGAIWISERV